MTNGEKYTTTQERVDAFEKWCEEETSNTGDCTGCHLLIMGRGGHNCRFHWLDLEADEENPLPCPFCGGEAKEIANFGGVHLVMCDCGYSSTETSDKESAIAAHNRVAKAVRESEANHANA